MRTGRLFAKHLIVIDVVAFPETALFLIVAIFVHLEKLQVFLSVRPLAHIICHQGDGKESMNCHNQEGVARHDCAAWVVTRSHGTADINWHVAGCGLMAAGRSRDTLGGCKQTSRNSEANPKKRIRAS